MTYQEKINKLSQDRGLALSSLSSAYKEENNKIDELNFYYSFLFGTGGNNIGLINILELYYREINISVGRTTLRPALQGGIGTSQNAWKTAFNNAIRTGGDDEDGFYPPDANNLGAKTFNESADFLTTNDDQGETEGGIVSNLIAGSDIKIAIGEVASQNADARGPFDSLILAEEHRDETRGSGILGRRTENSEITSDIDENTFEEYWEVGENGIDFPDWYNTPYKTNFESALTSIISSLNTYKNHLDDIKEKLQFILDGNHALFEEASMSSDMPIGDISAINTLQTTIQQYIDDLQTELNYFSGFTASDDISLQSGYVRIDFNNKLTTIIPTLLNDIITTLQTRAIEVRTVTNYNNASESFRNWIKFWIKQSIGKYDGPLLSINGMQNDVIPSAIASLSNANEALQILFGTEYNRYLAQPNVFAAFFNPTLNEETGEIISKRVGIVWMANIAANRYNIYRRRITNEIVLLNNDEWNSSYLAEEFAETNEQGTMVRSDFTDESNEIQNGGLFVYRVKSFDTNTSPKAWNRLDIVLNQDTSSRQSDIIGKTYSIASIEENVIELYEKASESFGVCFIENKYYGVLKVKDKKVILAEAVTGQPSSLIEIKAGVFVP